MFYDALKYPFLKTVIDNLDVVITEFNSHYKKTSLLDEFANYPPDIPLNERTKEIESWVYENGFHPEQTGYDSRDGEWTAFPLMKKDTNITWYDVKKSFPNSYNLVKDIPQLNLAAFFRLAKNAGTKEHYHTQKNLIFHICLNDLTNGESVINCDGQSRVLKKKGDWCLFNYSKPHSSFNSSSNDRINFAIDFTPANSI